jgi:RNA polymerase sigma factor (TIGR02999 family)
MTAQPRAEITTLLRRLGEGDPEASEELARVVYRELKQMAGRQLRRERTGHTLQATDLVHEAYVRLLDQEIDWKGRTHFFFIAGETMRRVLIEHARTKKAAKRGGGAHRVPLEELGEISDERAAELIALDEALKELEKLDAELARVVELRFFAGLTAEQAAGALGVSAPTVNRRWRLARAWLTERLGGAEVAEP